MAIAGPSTLLSPLEVARASHVAVDVLTAALTELLVQLPSQKTHRERVGTAHRAAFLLDRIADRSATLRADYEDANRFREAEIDSLGTGLPEFYQRLSKLKKAHREKPEEARRGGEDEARADAVDYSALEGPGVVEGRDFLDRLFSGEESLGRFFDLNSQHAEFINLPPRKARGTPYLSYLDDFDAFDKIDRSRKGEEYAKYVAGLLEYLVGFFHRAFPLADFETEMDTATATFNQRWADDQIESWPAQAPQLDGDDAGIWCGACQRSYAKQTVFDAHLSSKKHLKAAAASKASGASPAPANGHAKDARQAAHTAARDKDRPTALNESLVRHFMTSETSPLVPIRAETKANVERKQALTDRERRLELLEVEERERKEAEAAARASKRAQEMEEVEKADNDRIYNPLKLPLGWDGKPIPFWLYKLHGLGVEYSCEICSGHVYQGRKNFERHFQEARHSFGMRALGLPNTKHFADITKIEDAIALAEKLKAEGKSEATRERNIEEVEDSEGNVYNRTTYEDLARQGLL